MVIKGDVTFSFGKNSSELNRNASLALYENLSGAAIKRHFVLLGYILVVDIVNAFCSTLNRCKSFHHALYRDMCCMYVAGT